MKRIIVFLLKILYHIINLNRIRRLHVCVDFIYTAWLKNDFRFSGNGLYIEKPIRIIGGKNISIGHNTAICRNCVITAWTKRKKQYFSPNVMIGNNCSFGAYNHITCINKIIIGDGVLTGRWVTITDNSHGIFTEEDLTLAPILRDVVSKGPVIIEDNVWIGEKVTILPNVRIGKGSVIAANAVVTKNIPSFSIAAGIPAKVIKQISI